MQVEAAAFVFYELVVYLPLAECIHSFIHSFLWKKPVDGWYSVDVYFVETVMCHVSISFVTDSFYQYNIEIVW